MPIYVGSGSNTCNVPDCLGKICEEAWLCRNRHLGSDFVDFEVLYIRWRDETIWHSISFDYGPLFWYQWHGDPFVKYEIDRDVRRSQPDQSGRWRQLIDLASGEDRAGGLALRSIRGGERGSVQVAVLTFEGGAPERDVHLFVWQSQRAQLHRMVSRVGARVGPLGLGLTLDQQLVGVDRAK